MKYQAVKGAVPPLKPNCTRQTSGCVTFLKYLAVNEAGAANQGATAWRSGGSFSLSVSAAAMASRVPRKRKMAAHASSWVAMFIVFALNLCLLCLLSTVARNQSMAAAA